MPYYNKNHQFFNHGGLETFFKLRHFCYLFLVMDPKHHLNVPCSIYLTNIHNLRLYIYIYLNSIILKNCMIKKEAC